jgi:ribosomal protein S27AE
MIRLIKISINRIINGKRIMCDRCRTEIIKGECFIDGYEVNEVYERAFDRKVRFCVRCGASVADKLDSIRINKQLSLT